VATRGGGQGSLRGMGWWAAHGWLVRRGVTRSPDFLAEHGVLSGARIARQIQEIFFRESVCVGNRPGSFFLLCFPYFLKIVSLPCNSQQPSPTLAIWSTAPRVAPERAVRIQTDL